jgi:Protein of unknown function (DUF2442)
MSIAISAEPKIREVSVSEDMITAHLADGRAISVPLSWSWRLSDATPEQRKNFEILGSGQGVRWPDIDEDISVEGMLSGTPARRPPKDS